MGGERSVMLGSDLVLPGSLVKDPRLDYVALGHIHKPQDLNKGSHPPVVYPGSIERVDFGEAQDERFFVIANVEKGNTRVEWRKLEGVRPFVDRFLRLDSAEEMNERMRAALPGPEQMKDAIVRLTVEYAREWEPLFDEASLRKYAGETFEFHLVKRPIIEARARLGSGQSFSSYTPMELLDMYWKTMNTPSDDTDQLRKLAEDILRSGKMDG